MRQFVSGGIKGQLYAFCCKILDTRYLFLSILHHLIEVLSSFPDWEINLHTLNKHPHLWIHYIIFKIQHLDAGTVQVRKWRYEDLVSLVSSQDWNSNTWFAYQSDSCLPNIHNVILYFMCVMGNDRLIIFWKGKFLIFAMSWKNILSEVMLLAKQNVNIKYIVLYIQLWMSQIHNYKFCIHIIVLKWIGFYWKVLCCLTY